ncbi:MAG: hypothetical protein COX55_02055 [Zetaproteobacteria bacterium CG23_combo_of_CG06-09_8_20_14_all_54_7]|nr:MAG: hypothetical protein AUJ56_09320 [Zetaproteobacteria bacterium CG1_02_49_23]PIP03030.1 MAG: hypothetical protein COX55_02055 [Zetaproteobacteria bacterium CG23_combo_of_CG06-09_8_20_14_all_54_7]
MAELPLLLFPSPETASKTPGHGNGGNFKRPSVQRQGERLSPVFQQLQNSFRARNVELQQTPAGIDPEQVLVIETVGNVEDFANAVKKIRGLEWMGELALENIAPDDDFQDEKDPSKELSGRLYLVMGNQSAMTQMLSLWQRYLDNPADMNFKSGDYRGLAKFKDVFLHLKDIRRWGVQDRLAEKEVFDVWKENLAFDSQRNIRFEAELWYRGSEEKRLESESIVTELIRELGGSVISQCAISSIAYHSVLGEIPAQAALNILELPEVDLIKCENIMFFRPTGQMATGREPEEGEVSDCALLVEAAPVGKPIVAVLDGLPLENHQLLSGRLIVDDPDDWASEYSSIDRRHGTAMTSLIVHGDLGGGALPLNKPVYVRPIMKPNPTDFRSPREECVPEDVIFVDYIHRVVKRMMEGDADEEAVAPSVKVVNLSIGDRSRHFSQAMSPLARLLDWLSAKYNILFVISSGNHSEAIETDMTRQDFEALSSSEREALIVKKIYGDARHRRLLSPGESINGLTVGASHHDLSSGGMTGHLIDVFESALPSPVSAFGLGYRRAVKPDFLFSGGRALYSISLTSGNAPLQFSNRKVPPGNQVAAPSASPGETNKSQYCCGSSNSAALTSRAAAICYDHLAEIFSEQAPEVDFTIFGVPILKAMLVHGCRWGDAGATLERLLLPDTNRRQIKSWVSRWMGYGLPDIDKVLGCNEQRATLLGFGQLNDGEAHVYELPLPPSLNAQREKRRFTVTLAWLSPIAASTQRYREAQLWFDFEDGKKSREKLKGKLRVTGIDSDSDITRRGTVQHEIFEGESAVAISDGDTIKIKVNCRKDARKFGAPVAYGLAVSLEVAEGVNLPIYNDIRTRITPAIEIRAGGQET